MPRKLLMLGCVLLACGTAVAQQQAESFAVGDRAPNFTVTGIDGETFELTDKLAENKNLVLMFSRAHW